jgi:hypothetical protein
MGDVEVERLRCTAGPRASWRATATWPSLPIGGATPLPKLATPLRSKQTPRVDAGRLAEARALAVVEVVPRPRFELGTP